jgi:hypothetical protein
MATEQQVEQAKAELARALDGVPAETARSALNKVAKMYGIDDLGKRDLARDAVNRLDSQIVQHDRVIADSKRKLEELEKLKGWPTTELRLERNDCSRVHRLKEAAIAGQLISSGEQEAIPAGELKNFDDVHAFVVKHDWATALRQADVLENEIKLPYPRCAFEFRISGRSVIALFREVSDTYGWLMLVEAAPFWYVFPKGDLDSVQQFVFAQVLAICVALDADVATHTVVRAPHKLNEKRERAGKPKLLDYHVVDLARRHRVANPSGATGGGGRKRLHWRRGHWRHFETSKTWVKWCLVGDPDLGFINKHYKL